MSYTYYFDSPIDTTTVNDLVDKLQVVEGKIELTFSTEGGYIDSMSHLIRFLNRRKEDVTITLTDRVASAGTKILTDFKGKIKFSGDLDFILFHAFDRESYSIRKNKISEKILTEQDMDGNIIFAKKLKNKGILNKKQIKQFLKGQDVILYRDEILKIKI